MLSRVFMSCVGQVSNHFNHVVPTGGKSFSGRTREKPQVAAIKASSIVSDDIEHHTRTEEPKFLPQ